MTTNGPVPGTSGSLPTRWALVIVVLSFIAVFFASGTPVPLYNTYRAEDGVTAAGLAVATVLYLATTAVALLTMGRLSNHFGRRPVAIAAVLCAAVGCAVMLNVHSLTEMVAGRMVQGIACGVASSALGSYVLDLALTLPGWIGPVITSNTPPFAIPLGALLSGTLVQYVPAPRTLIYTLVIVLLVVLAALLTRCPETIQPKPGALASLRPRVFIPRGEGRLLFAVGTTLVATWALSGFYQAFSPVLAADELGTTNALVVALVFSSIVVLSPAGGLLTGGVRAVVAVRAGMTLFVVATGAILVALHVSEIWWFLAVSGVAGIAQGATNAGGMRAILGRVGPEERAGLLSTLYLISYSGAAVPGLLAGHFATFVAPDHIAYGYGALILVAAVITMIALPRTSRNQT